MYVDGRARGYRAPAGAMGSGERSYDCEIQVCTELPRNTLLYRARIIANWWQRGVTYVGDGAAGSPVRTRRQGSSGGGIGKRCGAARADRVGAGGVRGR